VLVTRNPETEEGVGGGEERGREREREGGSVFLDLLKTPAPSIFAL
jgi:hypothetical protein